MSAELDKLFQKRLAESPQNDLRKQEQKWEAEKRGVEQDLWNYYLRFKAEFDATGIEKYGFSLSSKKEPIKHTEERLTAHIKGPIEKVMWFDRYGKKFWLAPNTISHLGGDWYEKEFTGTAMDLAKFLITKLADRKARG